MDDSGDESLMEDYVYEDGEEEEEEEEEGDEDIEVLNLDYPFVAPWLDARRGGNGIVDVDAHSRSLDHTGGDGSGVVLRTAEATKPLPASSHDQESVEHSLPPSVLRHVSVTECPLCLCPLTGCADPVASTSNDDATVRAPGAWGVAVCGHGTQHPRIMQCRCRFLRISVCVLCSIPC